VEQAYAAADVFVLPSVSEGLSNALLEAMASGLAVLGSRVGGTAETVRPDVTGLLFGPQDGVELRRGIARFLSEPELGRRLGASARAQAVAEFAIDRVADEYKKMYSE
jgi:glycosyltransferase involved in cell wall biosynthesis